MNSTSSVTLGTACSCCTPCMVFICMYFRVVSRVLTEFLVGTCQCWLMLCVFERSDLPLQSYFSEEIFSCQGKTTKIVIFLVERSPNGNMAQWLTLSGVIRMLVQPHEEPSRKLRLIFYNQHVEQMLSVL